MRNLQFKYTLLLIALTLAYLCLELGFNARLLDVVGGGATARDVERIELYGRSLSGVAAALVVLQLMLRRRTPDGQGPAYSKIVFFCLLTPVLVFVAIKGIVDLLGGTRDAEFRRMALNATLLQHALVAGNLKLDGLVDDSTLFTQPEGKAFLALFPLLAVSVRHLDERTDAIKDQLIEARVRRQSKGPQGYYAVYQKTMQATRARWLLYVDAAPGSRALGAGGERLAPGLAYPAYVMHPGVQRELRAVLRLPAGASVAAAYAGPQQFTRLYEQFVAGQVRELRAEYHAGGAEFAPGARYYQAGSEAARAIIVPPLALFFSLVGAISHFSKLLYLCATLLFLMRSPPDERLSRRSALVAAGVLVLVFSGIWSALSLVDNNITRSDLFQQMIVWTRQPAANDGVWRRGGKVALTNIAHVVAVGQGYGYPVNETIRAEVLRGFDYGYQPDQR